MKTTHALNFFFVGLAMCSGPAFWPQQFIGPANGVNTSEIWLLVMGGTQAAMGAWMMAINEVPRLTHLLQDWEPFRMDFALPDVGWTLPESFYAGLKDDEEVGIALLLQEQLRLGRS
jgi:hypothetical protein